MKISIIFPIFVMSFISIFIFIPDMHGPKYVWSYEKENISMLETAISYFEHDNGRIPTEAEGLEALVNRPDDSLDNWKPYIRVLPSDRWSNGLKYKIQVSAPNGYIVYSMGPNAEDENGGPGDISNIQSEYPCAMFDDCLNISSNIFYISLVTCVFSLVAMLILLLLRVIRFVRTKKS